MFSPQTTLETFDGELMTELDIERPTDPIDWLWDGYFGRGMVTLLTSQWKTGKTTLLTGLLKQFEAGGAFLGRSATPAKVLVVSEESRETWADRLRRMPVGPNCRLLSRPFRCRPSPEEWQRLVDYACDAAAHGDLDLLVIDPLAKFLPGSSESDITAILKMLNPLEKLTTIGGAVAILHHPRKKNSEEGSSARGNGGLLAAVDIILELSRFGSLRADERRRKLFALSRYPATPRRLVYEWDPATCVFTNLGDPFAKSYEDNWSRLQAILSQRKVAATHQELLADWPLDEEKPSRAILYAWLNRAFEQKRLRRKGSGTKLDPFRYRLENEDDEYYDRGELPPLRDLNESLRNGFG